MHCRRLAVLTLAFASTVLWAAATSDVIAAPTTFFYLTRLATRSRAPRRLVVMDKAHSTAVLVRRLRSLGRLQILVSQLLPIGPLG